LVKNGTGWCCNPRWPGARRGAEGKRSPAKRRSARTLKDGGPLRSRLNVVEIKKKMVLAGWAVWVGISQRTQVFWKCGPERQSKGRSLEAVERVGPVGGGRWVFSGNRLGRKGGEKSLRGVPQEPPRSRAKGRWPTPTVFGHTMPSRARKLCGFRSPYRLRLERQAFWGGGDNQKTKDVRNMCEKRATCWEGRRAKIGDGTGIFHLSRGETKDRGAKVGRRGEDGSWEIPLEAIRRISAPIFSGKPPVATSGLEEPPQHPAGWPLSNSPPGVEVLRFIGGLQMVGGNTSRADPPGGRFANTKEK